jgi:hypothetical protein
MGTAGYLDTHLPGTKAALREGTVSLGKARIIALATALLDPDEAAAAEDKVLDRAARLTPGGLRAAIARAVIEAAPEKAKRRREAGAKFARVERWFEDTGNAALAGRELAPGEALAADERITAWARELKAAGLDGGMDELRARAYLDLPLGTDSRPGPDGTPASAPAGFAGRVMLTVPLTTLAGLADCPRSGTPPAPARSAVGPPPGATSSTTPRTKQADARACATRARSVAMITGSSSTRSGRSTSSPTGRSPGPPHRDGPTPPNPPATRSKRTVSAPRLRSATRG